MILLANSRRKPMSQPDISDDWATLMRQASMTAAEYMDAAVRRIDATFGKGYAARDYSSSTTTNGIWASI